MKKEMKKVAPGFVGLTSTIILMSLLVACSTSPIDTAYRQSELHQPLKIPAGLDQPLSNPRLMIPEGAAIDESGRVAGIDELDVDFELPPQLNSGLKSEVIQDSESN